MTPTFLTEVRVRPNSAQNNSSRDENGSPASWLNRNVFSIGIASLCSDIGHEMATSLLPAFLTTLGFNAGVLGLIEGLADGLSSFAKLLSGVYSDRLRKGSLLQ